MSGKFKNRFQRIVWAHLRRVKGRLCLAALCTLGYTAAELLSPWPLKIIFDHVLLEKPLTPVLSALGGVLAGGKSFATIVISTAILLIAAAKGAFSYSQLYLTSRVGHQMVYTLRRELFAHLQRLSLSFHSRARSGELLTKVTSDTNTLKDVFSESALSFISQVLSVAGMFVVLFALNWRLSLIVLTTFPALLWTIFAIYRRVKSSARQQREREGRIATRISEAIGSVVLVRAFGRENYEQQRFDTESSHNLSESVRTARMEAGSARAVEIINAAGIWAAVLFGALQVVNGGMTPGEVLIFTAYLTNMYKPLRLMAKLSTQFSKAAISAERISEILNIEPDCANDEHGVRIKSLRGEIAFQQVSFDYGDDKSVLNGVSFVIASGQRVALVGASGAGKSTIASLILRFYRPQHGQVLIDGLPIGEYHRESLRREIGVVLQDNILFGSSIRENIAYGKPDASPAEIEHAARLAYAHDFIVALPEGFDTILGERGSTLSGGQRQRICLARAIIKQPSILILDEPTAAVDAESSYLIGRAVERLQRGKTTLVISHQFTAMDSFDQIIVLKNGVVVEIGTHQQLLARRGYYFELHRFQGYSEESPTAIIPIISSSPQSETEPLRITQTFKRPNFRRAEV